MLSRHTVCNVAAAQGVQCGDDALEVIKKAAQPGSAAAAGSRCSDCPVHANLSLEAEGARDGVGVLETPYYRVLRQVDLEVPDGIRGRARRPAEDVGPSE